MSWERVESNTISNCWKHTKLVSNDEEEVDNLDLGSQIEIEDMEFNDKENEGIHGEIIDLGDNYDEDPTMLDENDDQVGNENGVKQEDVLNAMRFVIENTVPVTEAEFDLMRAFSKFYVSRREDMIANR
ncbi:hypothetical protein, partial, partial [Parasitella parasitica]